MTFQPRIAREAHDHHIASAHLGDVAELLHYVLFSMKRGTCEAGAAATSSIAIHGTGNDATALYENGQMKLCVVGIAFIGRFRILQKVLQNPSVCCVKLLSHC